LPPAEIAALQVAAVVIATVLATSLLIGAGTSAGVPSEGLVAFTDGLAASAAAGASAAQLQPNVDAMLAFSQQELRGRVSLLLFSVLFSIYAFYPGNGGGGPLWKRVNWPSGDARCRSW
jgi:hypothetical protein